MPARRTTAKGYDTVRKLRKNPTPAERKLWSRNRNDQLGVNFRRQHAIGNYIPDFVCIKKKLILELDGSQHLEQVEYDNERTQYLKSQEYKVIRFWNNDAMENIEGVILAIMNESEKRNNSWKQTAAQCRLSGWIAGESQCVAGIAGQGRGGVATESGVDGVRAG